MCIHWYPMFGLHKSNQRRTFNNLFQLQIIINLKDKTATFQISRPEKIWNEIRGTEIRKRKLKPDFR